MQAVTNNLKVQYMEKMNTIFTMHPNLRSLGRMRVNDAPIIAFSGFKVLCEAGLVTMHVHKQSLHLQTWLRERTRTDLRVWTGLSLLVSAAAAWSSAPLRRAERGASIGARGLRASGPLSPGPGRETGPPGSTWAWTAWSPLAEDHYVKQFTLTQFTPNFGLLHLVRNALESSYVFFLWALVKWYNAEHDQILLNIHDPC